MADHSMPVRIFARKIEEATTASLVLAFFTTTVGCGGAYFLLGFVGHGIDATFSTRQADIFDCIYFSVVTVSSLGFGDFRPLGFARILSMVEVLVGLGLLALIIGRIASGRQSALIQLTYAAEQRRQVNSFQEDIEEMAAALRQSDGKSTARLLKRVFLRIDGFRRYLVFQVHSVGFLNMQSMAKIRSLVSSLIRLLRVEEGLSKYATDGKTTYQIKGILWGVSKINGTILYNSTDDTTQSLCRSLKDEILLQRSLLGKERGSLTEEQLAILASRLPVQPWPVGVHKEMARLLVVSNTAASQGIQTLINRGHFLPQQDGGVLSSKANDDRVKRAHDADD